MFPLAFVWFGLATKDVACTISKYRSLLSYRAATKFSICQRNLREQSLYYN